MSIKEVLRKELSLIELSPEEEKKIEDRAKEIAEKLESEGLKAEIGGSLAKGTIVRKALQDIDIFIVFEKEEETGKLEEVVKKLKLKAEKTHGSRDYFRINEKGVVYELIPVVKLKKPEGKTNVTDFSLSHVRYVVKKLKKKNLRNEIKLAKSFCHAQEVYGAESYINGFSGYALELLILHFGSFENFLKKIEKTKVIDIEKEWKNEQEIRKEINASKLQSPLILIDPTFKYRNVTACLSKETFNKFLEAAREFLANPDLKFFARKELDLNQLKQQAKDSDAKLISLSLNTDKQEGDIAGTKMKKFAKFVADELERKEQIVLRKEFEYDEGKSAFAYFIAKEKKEIEIKGPPLSNKNACEAFKKARKKVFPKGGHLWARQKFSMKEFLQNLNRFEEEMSVKMNFSIA